MKHTLEEKKLNNIELEKLEKIWMEKVSKDILHKFGKEMKERNYSLANVMRDINFELQLIDISTQKIQDFITYMEDVIENKLNKIKSKADGKDSPQTSKANPSKKNVKEKDDMKEEIKDDRKDNRKEDRKQEKRDKSSPSLKNLASEKNIKMNQNNNNLHESNEKNLKSKLLEQISNKIKEKPISILLIN